MSIMTTCFKKILDTIGPSNQKPMKDGRGPFIN